MSNRVWVVLSAVITGLAVGGALTWKVQSDAAPWEARRAEIQRRREQLQPVEAQVNRLDDTRKAITAGRLLAQRVRGDQAAAAALLSAMGVAWDARVERVSLKNGGGEISGHADSPVAANEVGERLAARELLGGYELRRFDNRAFTLTFTLPSKEARP